MKIKRNYISSGSKPSPLTEAFTYEYFRNLYSASGKKLSAKAFLATEQRIPGLGNGVLQDILWDAGIDPRYDMTGATEEDFKILYASVKKILREMCDKGGRNTEKTLFGEKGGYVYFCEKCQKR